MKCLLRLLFAMYAFSLLNSCAPKPIANALADAVILDSLCVSTFSFQITPGPKGSQNQNITFSAVLNNKMSTAGKGGIMLLMNVYQSSGTQSLTTTSQQPGFQTANTTVYPANGTWTSPALVTTTFWPGATYTITIEKWLVGQNGWDKNPCHNFTITQTIFNP